MWKTVARKGLPNVKFLLLIILMIAAHPASSFAAEIKLAWNASPDPKVTGYRIYYSRVSGQYDKKRMVDVGKATTHVMQLDPGGWYFVVTAYDSQGNESRFSEEIIWRPDGVNEESDAVGSAKNSQEKMPDDKLSPSRRPAAPGAGPDSHSQRMPGQGRRISPSVAPKNLK